MYLAKRLCALFLLLVLGVGGKSLAAEELLGGDFSLTDQFGNQFELQQLRGKVVLLFFGYTYCPDICPTELSSINMLLRQLQGDAEQVQGIFVSVDPERDTPEVLKKYLAYFNKSLIGLTGSSEEVATVAAQYRAKYAKHERTDGPYSMDHSASLYVIDRVGKLSTVIPYGLPPEHMLGVVQHLLHEQPAGQIVRE